MLNNNETIVDNLSINELAEGVDAFSRAGLHYVAGFVVHRFEIKYPCLEQPMKEIKNKKKLS